MPNSRRLSMAVLLAALLGGCAGTSTLAPERESIGYREDPDLQRVWLADGVSFQSYDTFVVRETRTEAINVNPDGLENLAWARGFLRNEVVTAIRAKKLFRNVSTSDADVQPGAQVLRLDNVIVEYEKGGGGARFWAGLYGAGQPVIRVRGRVTDGDRLIFAFEARRSGDSGLARMFGGYRTDRAIQEEDIRDLARDLADFIVRNGKLR